MNLSCRPLVLCNTADGTYDSIGTVPLEKDIESIRQILHESGYGTALDFCLEGMWQQLIAERRIFLVLIQREIRRFGSV